MQELSLVTGGAGFIGSHLVESLTALLPGRRNRLRALPGYLLGVATLAPWQHRFGISATYARALPLTALNDALRATILEGSSLASQSGRILVLALWGGISFALQVRKTRPERSS